MGDKIIDKEYWLGFGYDLIDNGLKTLYKEIDAINNYINGLLIFYGAVSTLGSIYSRIDDFWHYFYIVLPILVIKGVDWYANVFSRPKTIEFYPDSPQSCEWAHDEYFKQAETHLKNIKAFALITTILVLAGFVYINWESVKVKKANDSNTKKIEALKKEKDSLKSVISIGNDLIKGLKQSTRYDFRSQYVPDENEVLVLGNFPKDVSVRFEIFDLKLNSLAKKNSLSEEKGKVNISISLMDNSLKKAWITAEYELSKNEKRLIRKKIDLNTGL